MGEKRLPAQGREPLLVFERVKGTKVVTNIFASRARIARLLGCEPDLIHKTYQEKARKAVDPKIVSKGPILDSVEETVDLTKLPLLKHFETDKAPYITNGLVVCEEPGNLSYHRAMLHSKTGNCNSDAASRTVLSARSSSTLERRVAMRWLSPSAFGLCSLTLPCSPLGRAAARPDAPARRLGGAGRR